MTAIEFAEVTAVMAIGSLVQGSIGFGLALFAAPLLALINPTFAPGPLLIGNAVLTGLMARREWHAARVADLGWALGGRILGIGAALAIMAVLSPRGIDLWFGAIVLVAVAMAAGGFRFRITPSTLFTAGITSGIMGTATAIGGPPMALVYQHESGARIRGTLSAYFTVGALLSAAGLAIAGRFGRADVQNGLLLCPGILLGYTGSHRFLPLVDRKGIRPALLVVAALSAAMLIARRM